MTTTRVAWRRSDAFEADEHCTLTVRGSGLSLVGTVLGAVDGAPVRIEYRVLADPRGFTTAVFVRELRGFDTRTIELARDAKGGWTLNGKSSRALRSCSDVDLAFSPATNTLPIRRLGLAVGASSTIKAAWLRYPELVVAKTEQTYTRLDESTFRYASGTFEGELTVDDDGLVAAYGPWRRTAYALGPEDTQPLDAVR